MSGKETDRVSLRVVKTRLLDDEREYLERVAAQEDRSVAWVLRRLVIEAKEQAA